jgi:protein-S-isoprenylcysteine O-methyltransferase Ste14
VDDESLYRWILVSILVIGLAMSAFYRRRADRVGGRVARRGDGPLLLAGLTLSGIAGLGGLIVYAIDPDWMAWSHLQLPRRVRLAGTGLGIVALGLFWWVFQHLGTNVTPTAQTRATHTLVSTGPYRFVRHPMYVSGLMLFAGYFLVSANWFIGLACGLTFLVLAARTPREERYLAERFGEEYQAYAARTGRFLPRVRR